MASLATMLRKGLYTKRWVNVAPVPLTVSAAAMIWASTQGDGLALMVQTTNAWLYNALEDSWTQLATVPVSATQPAACYHPSGPTGTASAGTSTTMTTTLTLPQSLAGYRIRITAGTGAGQEQVITGNTFGANAVITTAAWTTTPDNTSVYLILSGRFWLAQPSTSTALRYYDVATSAWSSALSITGLTALTNNNGSCLAATPAYGNAVTADAVATSASSTTLVNSGRSWTASQWVNYQVRITSGTGAGQVRTITANTSTTLTVATWTTNPDSTSHYVIEPNDDFLYLVGGNAVTLYRYSISANSWSTLTPGTARTTAPNAGTNLTFVAVASDASWAIESNIKNGRYLYSFAGLGSAALAIYDIAANSWNNVQNAFGRSGGGDFSPTSGWSVCGYQEYMYYTRTQATAGWTAYRFNAVTQLLDGIAQFELAQNTLVSQSQAATIITLYDSAGAPLHYLYYLLNWASSPTPMMRLLVV